MSTVYPWVLATMLAVALVVFVVLFFVSAPYGRHSREGWGPRINNRLGWLVMEAPAPIGMSIMMVQVESFALVHAVVLGLWWSHYGYRAFIYPLTLPASDSMPVTVAAIAVLFNTVNAFLIGGHFLLYPEDYTGTWLSSPEFVIGTALFIAGLMGTRWADAVLRNLKQQGRGYQVPKGFLYRWISCPNYFCESLQWLGWAVLTWSPAGFVFFIWTLANLVPRAVTHHRWYQQTFADYPPERRAFVPFVL